MQPEASGKYKCVVRITEPEFKIKRFTRRIVVGKLRSACELVSSLRIGSFKDFFKLILMFKHYSYLISLFFELPFNFRINILLDIVHSLIELFNTIFPIH